MGYLRLDRLLLSKLEALSERWYQLFVNLAEMGVGKVRAHLKLYFPHEKLKLQLSCAIDMGLRQGCLQEL